MTVAEYLRVLTRHRAALLLPVLGTLLAVLLLTRTPTQYRATAQLFFTAPNQSNDTLELVSGLAFLRARMPTYQALVLSPATLQTAIRSADLPTTATDLAARTVLDQPLPTTLLTITVRDTDPGRAARAANALAQATAGTVTTFDGRGTRDEVLLTVRQSGPAQVPAAPSSPLPWAVLAAGALFGLLGGLLLVAARHTRDSAVRDRAGVLQATGLDPLTVIPSDRTRTARAATPAGSQARAEAVKALRTVLLKGALRSPGQTLAVVSPGRGDGRTSLAVDLAHSLTLTGRTVVLVETDLQTSAIARLLDLPDASGLANVLSGQMTLNDVLVTSRHGRLSVLTAGWSGHSTTGLMSGVAMERTLQQLKDHYDHVIVDTPPFERSDTVTVAAICDLVLVAVRHQHTAAAPLAEMIRSLQRVGAEVAGTVLVAGPPDSVHPDGSDPPGANSFGAPALSGTQYPRESN